MKHKYLLFFIVCNFFLVSGYTQNCTSLGCADNYGSQTINTAVSSVNSGTCYFIFYKQVYWQFFYSPSGGNFTQTYTPTSTGDPLDLDYEIFDIGLSGPGSVTCPVNTTGFTTVLCMTNTTLGTPTGPGIDAIMNTVAGHFYAIAIYAYQDSDPTYSFTIGTPQIGGVNLSAMNCPGVLPVKLSSFEAKVKNCQVNLDWIAESESQFKQYELELSKDGRNFQTITTLVSQGAGYNNKYTYNHTDPVQGKNFYRLKMIDQDGRIEYSKIIVLNLSCSGSTVLTYPNPVTDFLNVNITDTHNEKTIASLYNSNGKLVYIGSMKNGTNNIDMTNFAKGIYILQLKNNAGTQNRKIIK